MDSRQKLSSSLKRQNDLMNRIDSMTGYSVDYDSEPTSQSVRANSMYQSRLDPRHDTTEHIELREALLSKNALLVMETNNDHIKMLLGELESQKNLADRYRDEIEEKQKELYDAECKIKDAEDECGRLTKALEDAGNKLLKDKEKRDNLERLLDNQKKGIDILKDRLDEAEEKGKKLENEIRDKDKKIKNGEKELKDANRENNKLKNEKEKMDNKIQSLENELDKTKKKAKNDNEKLSKELKDKENELADANEQNGNLQMKLDDVNNKLEDAEKNNDKLKKKLDGKGKEIDELTNQINDLADKYKDLQESYNKFYDETEAREADNLLKLEEAKKENEKILNALGASVILLHKINEASKKCKNCITDNMNPNENYSSSSTSHHSHSSSSSSSSSSPKSSSSTNSSSESKNRNYENRKPEVTVKPESVSSKKLSKSPIEPLQDLVNASDELVGCIDNIIATKGETDLSKYAEQFYQATGDMNLDIPVFNDLMDTVAMINNGVNKRLKKTLENIKKNDEHNNEAKNKIEEKMKELEDENKKLREDLDKIDDMTKDFHLDNVGMVKRIKRENGIDLASPKSVKSNSPKSLLDEENKGINDKSSFPPLDKSRIRNNKEDNKPHKKTYKKNTLQDSEETSSSRSEKKNQSFSKKSSKSDLNDGEESSNVSVSNQSFNTDFEEYASPKDKSVVDRVGKALELGSIIKDNILDQMKNTIDKLQDDKKKLTEDIGNLKNKLEDQEDAANRLRSKYSSLTVELQTSVSSASLFRKEVERLIAINKQLKEKNQKVEEELATEKLERRRVAESRLDLAQRKSEVEEKMAESIRRGIKSCGIDRSKSAMLHVASPSLLGKVSERMSTEELQSIVGSIEKALNDNQNVNNSIITGSYRTPRQSQNASRIFKSGQHVEDPVFE